MNFIDVNNVVKQYDGYLALDHVDLHVPQGCIYGLLGPNGAGKTSLIRIINRITHADSGTVMINGRPLDDKDISISSPPQGYAQATCHHRDGEMAQAI